MGVASPAAPLPVRPNAYDRFRAQVAASASPRRGRLLQTLSDVLLIPRIWRDLVRQARAMIEDEREADIYSAMRAADPTFEAAVFACFPDPRKTLPRSLSTKADWREREVAQRGAGRRR